MDIKEIYKTILNEHNNNPSHKKTLDGANYKLLGVNPSCGDEITLNLLVEGEKIKDATWEGSGCAVSQASADMMVDLIKGKSVEEAERLHSLFMKMIKGEANDEVLEELDEAALLSDVAKMPSRVKCATLSWRTLKEILDTKMKETKTKKEDCLNCTSATCPRV